MRKPLPSNWDNRTLQELAEFLNGFAFSSSDWTPHGTPIVRIAQMTDPSTASDHYPFPLPQRYSIDSGDLLFSWSASLIAMIWDRGPSYVNQHIYKVVPKKVVTRNFLHQLLSAHTDRLADESHGTTMRHITRARLLRYAVPLPPLPEQRAIAAVLDAIDEAIQKTEQIIAKLQQVKQGLLHDLLTRGIDDNGELRDPERHPEQFEDSPLGRIPKGWNTKPLGRCFFLQRGFDITVSAQRTGDVPVVSSGGVSSYHDTAMVNGPGVVTGRKGKLGSAYYIEVPFWPHDTTLWVKDFCGNDPEFAALFLGSFGLERFDAATSVPTLNRNSVHPLVIAIPSRSEQRRIVARKRQVDTVVACEERSRAKLRALKSALAEDLLTGRVRTTALLESAP